MDVEAGTDPSTPGSSPSGTGGFTHDIFVVYAPSDEPFVRGYLLHEIGLPADRVLLLSDLEPGQVIIDEIQRRVQRSRLTLVVLSPAYMADRWSTFGTQLASFARVERPGGGQVLPLWRADCTVPMTSRCSSGSTFETRGTRPGVARRPSCASGSDNRRRPMPSCRARTPGCVRSPSRTRPGSSGATTSSTSCLAGCGAASAKSTSSGRRARASRR